MSETMLWIVCPLVIVSVLYATLAGGYLFVQHRYGLCLMFLGYVIANIGLIMDAFEKAAVP